MFKIDFQGKPRAIVIFIMDFQGWEFAHLISERIARFLSKNERFAQKNERFTHSLIFGEQPERFAHDRSFPLSDLSELLMVPHFW